MTIATVLPASRAKEGFMGLLRQVLTSGRRVRISHNRIPGAAVLLAEDELRALEAKLEHLSDKRRLAMIARSRRAAAKGELIEYVPLADRRRR